MRLLYIADADDVSAKPGAVRCSATLRYLRNRFDVTYLSLSSITISEKTVTPAPSKRHYLFGGVFKGFNRKFRMVDSSCTNRLFFRQLWAVIRLFLAGNRYEVVYCSYKPAAAIWLGCLSKLCLAQRFILEYRDLASQFGDRQEHRVLNSLDLLVEKCALAVVDHVIVVSPTQALEFERAFGKTPTVVSNGVDHWFSSVYIEPLPARSLVLTYAGTLSERRGLQKLENCSVEGVVLWVFSNQNPNVHGLPEGLSCESSGYVAREDLMCRLAQSDAFLLIEGDKSSSFGNIPSKVFEYLAYRKPIVFIGSKDSDVYNLVYPTGLILHIDDISDLAESILNTRLLSEEYLRSLDRQVSLSKIERIVNEL